MLGVVNIKGCLFDKTPPFRNRGIRTYLASSNKRQSNLHGCKHCLENSWSCKRLGGRHLTLSPNKKGDKYDK